jgi:hypothetical protein
MTKTKRVLISLCVAALAGCSGYIGNSSDYIIHYLDKGFVGHPVNEFFYVYGAPAGKFDQGAGNVVYRWVSTQLRSHPAKVRVDEYTSTTGEYEAVDSYKGSIEHQYCELRILVDRNDLIRSFDIAVDSSGKWSTSRCSEIFNKVYP